MTDLKADYRKRQRKLFDAVRPHLWLEAALVLTTVLAFILGPKGMPNILGVTLLCLTPLVNIWRNVAMYKKMDEYERNATLRAVAIAGFFLLVGVFIAGMVGAVGVTESVSPLVPLGLFLGSYVVFGVAQSIILRREASE